MALIGAPSQQTNTPAAANNIQAGAQPLTIVYQLPTKRERILQALQFLATILTIVIAVRVLFFKQNSSS